MLKSSGNAAFPSLLPTEINKMMYLSRQNARGSLWENLTTDESDLRRQCFSNEYLVVMIYTKDKSDFVWHTNTVKYKKAFWKLFKCRRIAK